MSLCGILIVTQKNMLYMHRPSLPLLFATNPATNTGLILFQNNRVIHSVFIFRNKHRLRFWLIPPIFIQTGCMYHSRQIILFVVVMAIITCFPNWWSYFPGYYSLSSQESVKVVWSEHKHISDYLCFSFRSKLRM